MYIYMYIYLIVSIIAGYNTTASKIYNPRKVEVPWDKIGRDYNYICRFY